MITADDFKAILTDGRHLSPRHGDPEVSEEERGAIADSWWVARDVDPRAVDDYATWEANDSMDLLARSAAQAEVGGVRAGAVTSESLTGLLAATAEMALRVGWELREQKYRKELN